LSLRSAVNLFSLCFDDLDLPVLRRYTLETCLTVVVFRAVFVPSLLSRIVEGLLLNYDGCGANAEGPVQAKFDEAYYIFVILIA